MTTATQTRTTTQQITEAYRAQGAEWVSLETIRTELAHVEPAELDRAIREMAIVSRTALVFPVANLKSLTPGQRAAAVTIGGEACHMIQVKPVAVAPVVYRARHARAAR